MRENIKMDELFVNIEKAKNGDEDSLKEILDSFEVAFKGMAKKYYIPGGDAQDVIQIARIGLYEGIKTFNKEKNTNPKAFLKLCAERNLKDTLKALNRDKSKTLNVAISIDEPIKNLKGGEKTLAEIMPDSFSVESFIEDKDFEKYINNNIYQNMSKLQNDTFNLYMKDFSINQISEMLGLTAKQVDNAIQKAKKKLKANKEIVKLYRIYS